MEELIVSIIGGSVVLIVVLSMLAGLLCLILPFAFVFFYLRKRSQQANLERAASMSWLATTGTVLKSRVEISGGGYTNYYPYILYEYLVNGQTYQAEQVRAGDRFVNRSNSREVYDIVDQYPVGMSVTVYYDPANPTRAALER